MTTTVQEAPDGTGQKRATGRFDALAAILIGVYVVVGCTYAFLVPAWESPDEPAHYLYVAHLAEHKRPPGPSPVKRVGRFYEGGYVTSMYEWYQPALGYVWQALIFTTIDAFAPELLPDSFPEVDPAFPDPSVYEPQLFVSDRTRPSQLHPTDWGLILLRFGSLLLGVPLIWTIYCAAKLVLPDTPLVLAPPVMVALIPQFGFISATVRNDTASNLLATLVIFALLRFLTYGSRRPFLHAALLGTALAIAFLTKPTTSFLIPAAVVAVWLSPYELKQRFYLGVLMLLVAGGLVTMYYLPWAETRQALHYSLTHAQINPDHLNLSYILSIPGLFEQTFWGRFGWATVAVPAMWIKSATGLAALGVACTLAHWGWSKARGLIPPLAHRQLLFLVAVVGLNLVLILRYNLYEYQPQGRFLFPSLLPLSLFVFWGMSWLLASKSSWLNRLLLVVLLIGFVSFGVVALARGVVSAHYVSWLPAFG